MKKKEIKKKDKKKAWLVEVIDYILSDSCEVKIKKGRIDWCDERDEKCCEENCYGYLVR
jgi:hypothetical protein